MLKHIISECYWVFFMLGTLDWHLSLRWQASLLHTLFMFGN